MRNIFRVCVFVLLLFQINLTAAQGNDAIPACIPKQMQTVGSSLQHAEVAGDIRSIASALENDDVTIDLVIQSNEFGCGYFGF